jgi:transglutaminase-like putative cysteine protease
MQTDIPSRTRPTLLSFAAAILSYTCAASPVIADIVPKIGKLIDEGNFAAAEKLLQQQITDPSAPITSDVAIQLEIVRRTRQDFPLTDGDILSQLKDSIPDVTQADVDHWREAGDLQARTIDGELRYFRNAVGNLFRFSEDARKRRKNGRPPEKKYDLDSLISKLVRLAESSDSREVFPVKHRVRYELVVDKGNPRLKPGAKVRAWLPYPQEYRQQRDVKLIRSEPAHHTISDNGSPHRSIYFEDNITSSDKPPRFVAEFEFVTSAYCPMPEPAKAEPYDTQSDVYQQYTAERPPHIVFTPQIKLLAGEIAGNETNPLKKARRVFHWVSDNIPWCSEMEYSIIPNIPEKALKARRGDCGVQGLTFITLCRAAGVPARWQSGWQTKPGDWNMHDWSEFYVEPWGWLPADASYGVRKHDDPRVRNFLCGNMDPYRLIVNLDYARELQPAKTSFRSEPNDFQRGEIEIDGHNLYFGEWDWTFNVKTEPMVE